MIRTRSAVVLFAALSVLAAACTSTSSDDPAGVTAIDGSNESGEALGVDDLAALPRGESIDYGPAPTALEGELSPEVAQATDFLISGLFAGRFGSEIDVIVESGDGRMAWVIADLLRFFQAPDATGLGLVEAFEELTGADIDGSSPWSSATNHLIAWDLPAPPGYLDYKREIFLTIDTRWDPLFDANADDIDWRHVSWGGVLIDDRPFGDTERCTRGCIPALDSPATTDADGGDWFADDRIVFGVVVDGEARAYPKNIMEVHEMVNDTLGGRRIAIPYCTLCGSAQAYYTDTLDGQEPVFRTSGLLIRSNKMMFELNTESLVDTFLGTATSGPLHDQGVTFEQVSVITSTWGDWKAAHPDTTIVAEDGGIGANYADDPLRGRDDDGPIFPIGDVDERLPAQEQVLGVITEDGTPVAVHVRSAGEILSSGGTIEIDDVTIELDGAGIRATRADGSDAGGHQAFWFAWSQFHPDTELWPDDAS